MPNFNFSVTSTNKETPTTAIKKKKYKSPSQKKRDHTRKQIYLRKKVETPSSEESFEKPLVIDKQSKKPVTHDRFKCEQCDERLDTKNCLLNHMISEHNQPGDVLECDYCEFKTSRKTGLKIHISKKHDVIEQLDGNNSSTDEGYAESYWERDYMGTEYQTFLDAMEDIESANISLEEKRIEVERALKARENAFSERGDTLDYIHKRMPPWSTGGE